MEAQLSAESVLSHHKQPRTFTFKMEKRKIKNLTSLRVILIFLCENAKYSYNDRWHYC
jgi:hypothetical protein